MVSVLDQVLEIVQKNNKKEYFQPRFKKKKCAISDILKWKNIVFTLKIDAFKSRSYFQEWSK